MTRRGRRIAGTVVVALAAAVLVGATVGASEGAAGREVRIDIRYSAFTPDRVDVARGETVTFVLVNHDPIPHEFIVGDARVQLVHERGTEAHHPPRPGEISIPAGETRSTTMTFATDPGANFTIFGCHLPGHYAYGMSGVVDFV